VHLHIDHGYKLDAAYATAVSQFRDLRATHAQMTQFARMEAEAYGTVWKEGAIERGIEVEDRYLSKWWKGAGAVEAGSEGNFVSAGRSFTKPAPVTGSFTGGLSYLKGEGGFAAENDPSAEGVGGASGGEEMVDFGRSPSKGEEQGGDGVDVRLAGLAARSVGRK
jgi:hypothetical protein